MAPRLNQRDFWLWMAVAICVAYVVLWVCGIRIPPPLPRPPAVVLDEYEEEEEEPVEETAFSDKAYDVVLPEEPQDINDGRDPDPNAFLL
jgi:hypothetical protein